MKIPFKKGWSIADSTELYGVNDWGVGYFSVSEDGKVIVTPNIDGKTIELPLLNVVSDIKDRGMDVPVLIRFEDLLEEQIGRLNNAFTTAIKASNYQEIGRAHV